MRTTRRYTTLYNRNTTRRRSPTTWSSKSPTTYSCNASAFNHPRNECQWRLSSYHTVYTQFTGAGTKTCLSPTTANRWVKYINNGYRIYKFNNNEFGRYFGYQWQQGTPNACFRYLRQKYGSGIKAVTRGRTNTWLIAATPSVTGRPFQNYNWWWK